MHWAPAGCRFSMVNDNELQVNLLRLSNLRVTPTYLGSVNHNENHFHLNCTEPPKGRGKILQDRRKNVLNIGKRFLFLTFSEMNILRARWEILKSLVCTAKTQSPKCHDNLGRTAGQQPFLF